MVLCQSEVDICFSVDGVFEDGHMEGPDGGCVGLGSRLDSKKLVFAIQLTHNTVLVITTKQSVFYVPVTW